MKILLNLVILPALVLSLASCSKVIEKQQTAPEPSQNEVSRIDELQLEGFINDYFYRRTIKDPYLFNDFRAYGSVLLNSIVVYVYPLEQIPSYRESEIKESIKTGLQSTLLDFPDFEWVKDYSFDVVIR